MTQAARISPTDARRAIEQNDALLICAYDDREKCEELELDGSISFPDFQRRLDDVARDRELIFYCA